MNRLKENVKKRDVVKNTLKCDYIILHGWSLNID